MKIHAGRIFGAALSFIIMISVVSVNLFVLPSSAVYYKPGSVITFGSYPQTKVTDPVVINALETRASCTDNAVNFMGARYKRVYFTEYTPYNSRVEPSAENSCQDENGYFVNTAYWFKFEPVKWRVLSNSFDGLFIMSVKLLDAKPYNSKYDKVTWETSSMRSWLNNDFCKTAFTRFDMCRIQKSTVVNDDNPFYGTEGGNDTKDRVFLLSFKEVMNADYGFSSGSATADITRSAEGTDFAKCAGLNVFGTNGIFANCSNWWLRSPGRDSTRAGCINYLAIDMIGAFYYGTDVDYNNVGVRPTLKLRGLSILCADANPGFITDSANGMIYGIDPGTAKSFFESSMLLDSGTSLEYAPDSGIISTGTSISLIDTATNEVLETYTVVVFGDINGDGNIGGSDAGLLINFENYMISWDPAADAALFEAADVNGDGNVNAIDAGIIVNVENYLMTIDQTTGIANIL